MAVMLPLENALAIIVERIKTQFSPEKIILFGSQAKGNARMDSDIDILVIMSECDNRKATTISIMKSLADLPIGKDIIVTTPKEIEDRGKLPFSVLYPALNEGRVLYAR